MPFEAVAPTVLILLLKWEGFFASSDLKPSFSTGEHAVPPATGLRLKCCGSFSTPCLWAWLAVLKVSSSPIRNSPVVVGRIFFQFFLSTSDLSSAGPFHKSSGASPMVTRAPESAFDFPLCVGGSFLFRSPLTSGDLSPVCPGHRHWRFLFCHDFWSLRFFSFRR